MKLCKKCLLGESGDDDFYKHVRIVIEDIPEEEKTTQDEYTRRLEICKNCESLISGMCVLCGCYVEVRAAKRNQSCVKSRDVW